VFVEAIDLFRVVTGLLVEGAVALGGYTRRIPEGPRGVDVEKNGLKISMIQRYVQSADPAELFDMVDLLMPTIAEALSARERTDFIQSLLENHLDTLLQGVDEDARADLLNQILPLLFQEFPIHKVDILSMVAALPNKK
jgi:hypothetical protein